MEHKLRASCLNTSKYDSKKGNHNMLKIQEKLQVFRGSTHMVVIIAVETIEEYHKFDCVDCNGR